MSTLGNLSVDPARTSVEPSPPPARRSRQAGWRDPRLWLGVLLVAGSVLAGSRILATADRYVEVWAVTSDHAAGDVLEADDLTSARIRFEVDADLDRYLPVEGQLPERLVLLRDVGRGELVPRAGIGSSGEAGVLTVPISLPALSVPPGLSPGRRIDVWVTADSGGARATRVFEDVVVLGLPRARGEFGADGDRQLVLGLDEEQGSRLGEALGALGRGDVTVVARG